MNAHERLTILNRVRDELIDLHPDQPQCPGLEHCPTSRAIRDLSLVIGELIIEVAFTPDAMLVEPIGAGAEATYPAISVNDP